MQQSELIEIWNSNKAHIELFISKKVKNDSDIDDIIQEVFIKLWVSHGDIKDKNKTLNWLLSVARFTVVDHYRKKKNESPSIPDNYSLMENILEKTDESKKLLPIIYNLPAKYRNVLFLSEIFGLPHKIIAQQFGLTLSCVKTRVIRARKLLGEQMHECCNFSYDRYGNIVNCSEKKKYLDCIKNMQKMV